MDIKVYYLSFVISRNRLCYRAFQVFQKRDVNYINSDLIIISAHSSFEFT